MSDIPDITDTIDIAAPPARVWEVVSDLKAMGERSPQCVRMKVFGGEVKQGARTLNLNKQGWKYWPTTSKVTAFEPEKKLAFRITENRTVWTYDLEPTADGTRLTETRSAPDGILKASTVAVNAVLGGAEAFQDELRQGIRQTLETIKNQAERA